MRRPLCLMFLSLLAVFSLYYALIAPRPVDPYRDRDGETVTLTGEVTRKEKRKDYTGAEVTDLFMRPTGIQEEVRVLLQATHEGNGDRERLDENRIKMGETITVRGTLKCYARAMNPGEFDAYEYYLTQGVLFTVKKATVTNVTGRAKLYREWLYVLRCRLAQSLEDALSARDAGVMRTMLLGDRAALDEEVKDLYMRNGIMHILAVSGLHISILGLSLKALIDRLRLPRRLNVLLCVCFMYTYGVMCGMSTSAFRAIIMFALRLLAPFFKRTYDMLSAVSLCGIMLLLKQPRYAAYSGFLMSFGAILAIGYVTPMVREIFIIPAMRPLKQGIVRRQIVASGRSVRLKQCISSGKERLMAIAFSCVNSVAACFGVSLAMLPVYMCFYYSFPVVSLILNPLLLPLMGVLLPVGVLTSVIGLFSTAVARLCGLPCHLILLFYEKICSQSSTPPGAVWYAGAPRVWQVVMFYLLLAAVVWRRGQKKTKEVHSAKKNKGRNLKAKKLLVLEHDTSRVINGIITMVVAIFILSYRPDVPFQVTFLDVGQGDCSMIRAGELCYVVDGGSSSKYEVGRNIILPYLKYEGIAGIDAIILSHDDEDHISGIRELLDETQRGGLSCKQLILPAISQAAKGEAYLELEERACALQIPITYLSAGESWEREEILFSGLAPGNSPDNTPGNSPGNASGYRIVSMDPNANSLVLLVQYENLQVLLTGDTEGPGLQQVKEELKQLTDQETFGGCFSTEALRTVRSSEINGFENEKMRNENVHNETDRKKNEYTLIRILKVAHHGSRNNTDSEFLNLYQPDVAVISCGEKNRYGHPHKETLNLLEDQNARTCVTYKTGSIILRKNGKNAVISTFTGT